jgi:predicted lipoprotein
MKKIWIERKDAETRKMGKTLCLCVSVLIMVLFSSCDKNPNLPEPDEGLAAKRLALSKQTGEQIILPALRAQQSENQSLQSSLETFTSEANAPNLLAARAALKQAWLQWQSAAIFQFGPATTVSLRKSLNTFPTDTDQIEANIQSGTYVLGSLANAAAIGFPALDYLLNGLADSDSAILGLYTADLQSGARIQYLNDLMAEISSRTDQVLNSWETNGDNYLAEFTAEAAGGTDVGSALGLIVNAMDLHFQRSVRDGKVAIPVGIRSAGVPRPQATEAYHGGYSLALLVESIQAYQRLYLGQSADLVDGEGLYDYLLALEANALAEDIKNQFAVVWQISQTLNDPLSAQIETDPDPVQDLFLEMQKIVVLIKSDMASIMGISITNQDNDGD